MEKREHESFSYSDIQGSEWYMSDPVLERIEMLLAERGLTHEKFQRALGLSRNTFNNWKLQKSKTYYKRIDDIATFFEVSPNYILRGIDEKEQSEEKVLEDELIHMFRNLTESKKQCVITIVRAIMNEGT